MKPRLRFFLFFGFLLLLAWRWVESYPLPLRGAPALAFSLVKLLALMLSALGLGRSLLLRFKVFFASLTEEGLLSLGLGLGALSTATFLLGLMGGLFPWLAWLMLLAMVLVFFEHHEYFWQELKSALRSKHPWEGSSSEILMILALGLALAPVALLCLAPSSFYDAMVYHLALPMEAAASGKSLPHPGNLFSFLPGGMEQLYTLCLLLDSPRLAQLLNFSLGLLLGLALLDTGARLLPARRLWLTPVLALTQPALLLSFGVLGADGAGAFFCFLSLACFLRSFSSRNLSLSARWTALAALLAGIACAIKPVAALHAAALLMLWALRAGLEPDERRPGLLLLCFGLFLLPLMPWLARNAYFFQNPFLPFGLKLFGKELLEPASASYFSHMTSFGSASPWWRLPYDLLFEAKEGRFGGGGLLSFLLLAAPAALLMEQGKETRWLAFYLGLSFLLWGLGPRVLRYALLFVPAASLLAAFAATEAEGWARSKGWGLALRLFLALAFFHGAGRAWLTVVRDFDPFRAGLGLEPEEDYLWRQGLQYIHAARWLKEKAPKARVLILGDSRSAYWPAGSLATTVFDEHPILGWLDKARSPQELDALVGQKGYDFVLLNRPEYRRVMEGPGPHYRYAGNPEKEALLQAWLSSHDLGGAGSYRGEGQLLFPLR